MPEKVVYTLTDAGHAEFERLMASIAAQPIHLFLDFNAVIVNLDALPPEEQQARLADIEKNVGILNAYLENNLAEKEQLPEIPATGLAVLKQQLILANAIEEWLLSLKNSQV